MAHSPSALIWNNPPLAALHQMTEMTPAGTFLRVQHQSLIKNTMSAASGAGSPPVNSATPHGINDILNRNAAAAAALAVMSAGNPAVNGSRFLFGQQNMMASGTKHFQDLRSLYQCWPGMALANSLAVAKNGNMQPQSGEQSCLLSMWAYWTAVGLKPAKLNG
jgi:hypothetical protein